MQGSIRTLIARQFVCGALVTLVAACCAFAGPITYTGFTITDGKLGGWHFHNARVVLTLESDTTYVQMLYPSCVGVQAAYNSFGVAKVTIADHDKVVHATLAPNQVFVSFDQTNSGIGMGSFAPGPVFDPATCSNAASLQPAYPLGMHHGTMEAAGAIGDPTYSANQEAFPNNLQGNVGFSGAGYICVGIPREDCPAATAPLKTDHGDLYLAQPYLAYDWFGTGNEFLASINGAFFFQQTGAPQSAIPKSILAPSSNRATSFITYHLFLISDVSLGGELLQNASIHLTLRSRTFDVTHGPGGGPHDFVNSQGLARVEITSGNQTRSARFAPNQIYVYFNASPASAGFGSFAGGPAYPAVLAPTWVNADTELLAGVADILNGGTSYYSPATVALARTTDLKHATMLSDYVSSCPTLDFTDGVCSNLTTLPILITDKGDFYLYQAYNEIGFNDPMGVVSASNNWGMFWTTFESGSALEDDHSDE